MTTINFVLLVLALVCFLVAAIVGYAATPEGRVAGWSRTNFMALGLAFWVATALISAFPH